MVKNVEKVLKKERKPKEITNIKGQTNMIHFHLGCHQNHDYHTTGIYLKNNLNESEVIDNKLIIIYA